MNKKVVIYSPYKLDEKEITEIVSRFPVIRDRLVKNIVMDELLAGVVIHYDSKLIDLSIASGLQNLKQHVYENY